VQRQLPEPQRPSRFYLWEVTPTLNAPSTKKLLEAPRKAPETVTLHYEDERSNKIYIATLDGDTATFAWGPASGTMQRKVVTGAKAAATFRSKVAEKLAKGYKPAPESTPPAPAKVAEPVPRLQLLNEICEPELLRVCNQDGFWMQEKYDGVRALLQHDATGTRIFARSGKLRIVSRDIAAALAAKPAMLIDGELVDGTLCAFDLLEFEGIDLRGRRYSERLAELESVFAGSQSGIVVVSTARTCPAKLVLLQEVHRRGGEGIVLKRHDAPYSPGRPNSGGPALKFKFVATASVIVSSHHPEHSSVRMALADGTDVGSCTIPPNKERPPIGAIIEVRYLMAFRGGSLIQAVYLGERDDIERSACSIDQLRFKGEPHHQEVRE
jgi:bifunctional non-homologous end joining protein LigD